MIRPKYVKIEIEWIDEAGTICSVKYDETELEVAETLLGLMTGNINEEDLKP
jgi:hypothetical protein